MSKRIKVIFSLSLIITIIVISAISIINHMNSDLAILESEEIPLINLSTVDDGNYFGSYSISMISVEVEVTIVDHEITDITILEHKNGQGEEGENIVNDVILQQSVDIDFITGATYSSKAILLAIADALNT